MKLTNHKFLTIIGMLFLISIVLSGQDGISEPYEKLLNERQPPTGKVLSQDIDKNAITGNRSNIDQDTSSKKLQIRKYPFNPNQSGLPPIIVIDGKISDHGTSCLEPKDIQSISVYKDKKAASLYGDNNGAGVIIITTKKRAVEIKK